MAMTLPLQIGSFKVTLHLYTTTAPASYDGFGTFTIYKYMTGEKGTLTEVTHRLVAIPEGTVPYQTARYSSGLYAPRPYDPDDTGEDNMFWGVTPNALVDLLLKRISDSTNDNRD